MYVSARFGAESSPVLYRWFLSKYLLIRVASSFPSLEVSILPIHISGATLPVCWSRTPSLSVSVHVPSRSM